MSQYPQIFAGQDPTAGLLQSLAPFTVIKPADQNYASATLASDSALLQPLAANASYIFVAFFAYEGGTSGSADMKWAFTGPAGFAMHYQVIGVSAGGGNSQGFLKTAAGFTANTSGAGVLWGQTLIGSVTNGSAPGTLQAQFAQNTANAVNTIIHAGSAMALIRTS